MPDDHCTLSVDDHCTLNVKEVTVPTFGSIVDAFNYQQSLGNYFKYKGYEYCLVSTWVRRLLTASQNDICGNLLKRKYLRKYAFVQYEKEKRELCIWH
jgi:hypothetical protein